ncbi:MULTISPECIES: trypsin-like peptidase domain-containing protein [Oceanotoga]|jgi:Do/DeqQ family serine protease|uniref:Do/DeqQ family serine protease n=1 Tax=Oceanotoga teriensis TaxID=515440 RepID=A0AA45HHM6_9BACT|nr:MULTISPECIES: trypsin-like peptidase domain-containing protein [Oceanotoga]MDN5343550.1 serine protease Do [Oceanotoga sp.]MDO7977863.1 trypsin-like peptidase domain-containing protein [Oceanotoga teriensis]PWJ86808.1 Do/DeqQ family serine protease [Oceanotoga teriensis]
MKKVLVILSLLVLSINIFAIVNEGYQSPIVNVVKASSEAIVSIEAKGKTESYSDPYIEDFFKKFFGEIPPTQQREFTSLGTGFIFDEKGYIITNYHVVENATNINVTLGNDKVYEAKYIGGDKDLDLAVLKVNTDSKLPIVELGDSSELEIGGTVVAIGNPLGLSHTVTTGVISALNRKVQKPDGSGYYVDLIQTDAAINPGNSGGPLLNIHAQVIGVNTIIVNPNQGVNLGFAIPINLAKKFAYSIIDDGKYERAYLGVYFGDITEELRKSLGLKVDEGAYISDVIDNSAASDAGIKADDVIVKIDNKKISNAEELRSIIRTYTAGEKIEVIINRFGKEIKLNVLLGSSEKEVVLAKKDYFGLIVREITPKDVEEKSLSKNTNGVIVEEVTNNSPIFGITKGDLINQIAINGTYHDIKNVSDWEKIASSVEKNSYVALIMYRDNIRFVVKFFYR